MNDPQDQLQSDLYVIEQESRRMDGFRAIHLKSHPYPEYIAPEPLDETELTFWRMMGASAVGFMAAGVGGALAAAIRTTAMLAGSEYDLLKNTFPDNKGLAEVGGFLAGVFILLCIEGFLGAAGYARGIQSGKINTSMWGIIIAATISTLAGLLTSKWLLPDGGIGNLFIVLVTWLLVLASGPGITFLVIIGFENIGFLHNAWKEKVGIIKDAHKNTIVAAEMEFRNRQRVWEEIFEAEYQKRKTKLFDKNRQQQQKEEPKPQPQQRVITTGSRTEVMEWLAQHGVSANDVGPGKAITPAIIANDLNANSINVRTALSRIRNNTI